MPTPARVRLGERDRTTAQPQIAAVPAVFRYNAACSVGDAREYTDNPLISRLFQTRRGVDKQPAGPVARRPQPAKICANCCLKAAIWRRAIVGGRLQGHDIPNMRRSGLAQHFWGAG